MAYERSERKPGAPAGARRRFTRRKGCRFCADATLKIDYKETKSLRYFSYNFV